jgi:DNA repair exonuclease SbcCD ATPase subunit
LLDLNAFLGVFLSSFWKGLLSWLFWGFLLGLLLFYGFWGFYAVNHGSGILDALLWFKSRNYATVLHYILPFAVLGFFLGALVVFLYVYLQLEEFSRFEGLERRKAELQTEIERLYRDVRELRERIERFKREEVEVGTSVSRLKRERDALFREVRELREKVKNLDSVISRAYEEGYRKGWDEAYRKVIAELRSLRAQKSALMRLFDSNRELREVFRKVTGRRLGQFLKEAKRSVRNEGL